MQTASIATAKEQLSRLIEQVKQGESILITEGDRPVARLEPWVGHESGLEGWYADGLLTPPKGPLDLAGFLAMAVPRVGAGHALSLAVIAEREEPR